MSFGDELNAAKKRMLAQQEQERKSQGKKKKKTGRRSATEWSKQDEIIALYLCRANSSKFLRENYSLKRKISVRSMSLKINMFAELLRGRDCSHSITQHTQQVLREYGKVEMEVLQKATISILRGEYVESGSR